MKKLSFISLLTLILTAVSTSLIATTDYPPPTSSSGDRYLYYQFYYDDAKAEATTPATDGSAASVYSFYSDLSYRKISYQNKQLICTLSYAQFPSSSNVTSTNTDLSTVGIKETSTMIEDTGKLVHNNNGLFIVSFQAITPKLSCSAGANADRAQYFSDCYKTSLLDCFNSSVTAQQLVTYLSAFINAYNFDGIDINIKGINPQMTKVDGLTYVEWIAQVIKLASTSIPFITLSIPGQSYAYQNTFVPLLIAASPYVNYVNFTEYWYFVESTLNSEGGTIYNNTTKTYSQNNDAYNHLILNQLMFDLNQYYSTYKIPYCKMAVSISVFTPTNAPNNTGQYNQPLPTYVSKYSNGNNSYLYKSGYSKYVFNTIYFPNAVEVNNPKGFPDYPYKKQFIHRYAKSSPYGFNNDAFVSQELSYLINYANVNLSTTSPTPGVGVAGLTLSTIDQELYSFYGSDFPLSSAIITNFQTPFIPGPTTAPAANISSGNISSLQSSQ